MNRLLRAASLAALLLGAGAAHAATSTGTLGVTATVPHSCKIDAGSVLAFGTYDPAGPNLAANLDGSANMTIRCTRAGTYGVTFDGGANASGAQRRMAGPGANLQYDLYTGSSGGTPIVPNTTSVSVVSPGAANAVTLTVYGRIPFGQTVPDGAYSDSVVATITF